MRAADIWQVGLLGATLLVGVASTAVGLATRAAVAEIKVEMLKEIQQGYIPRPEFADLKTRFDSHEEREYTGYDARKRSSQP